MRLLSYLLFFCYVHPGFAQDCAFTSDLAREVYSRLKEESLSCLNKFVHFTFDDGPSPQVTPKLLEELGTRKIKATFFVTTSNLSRAHHHSKENNSIVARELAEGHLIADHGHDHAAHAVRMNAAGAILDQGYSQPEREAQIGESLKLLDAATTGKFSRQKELLFRSPYGRGAMPSETELKFLTKSGAVALQGETYAEQLKHYRRMSPALQTIAGSGLSHLGWNHDSGDSGLHPAMPEPAKVKEYVEKNLRSLCRSPHATIVALFHDIKAINTVALPVIADVGSCLGMRFLTPEEMLQKKKELQKAGTYIDKNEIVKGPVVALEETLQYAEEVVSAPVCETPPEKSCYSPQLQKRFEHCAGGDFICFEGKWLAKSDPVILENCHPHQH